MNSVTNEQFVAALKDKDNKKIISYYKQKYSLYLEPDDIQSCIMQALWECLANFKPEFNTKVSTSLVNYMKWRFSTEVKKHKKRKSLSFSYKDKVLLGQHNRIFFAPIPGAEAMPEKVDHSDEYAHIMHNLQKLDLDEQKIIKQRFLEELSYREIGKHNGYSKETAKNKTISALSKLRSLSIQDLI